MCGRARCTLRPDDVPRACHINHGPLRTVQMDRYRPSYNVSPGFNLPVVRREECPDGRGTVLHCMKWGLIPSFTKKTEKPDHYRMFNARSESITEKASFRRLIPNSRCVVAVEGFYEWKKDGSKKQPYYIHLKDGRPLVFAALYDSWKDSEGEVLYTFTILTTSSSSALQWLHDRMPVILGNEKSTEAWLNGNSPRLDSILRPYEESDLVWYPVTPAMGKASFDGPECVKEIKLKPEEKNKILKFFNPKSVGSNKEQGSNEEVKGSFDESSKANLQKKLKEELQSADDRDQLPFGDNDTKSNVNLLPHAAVTKCQIKRDYEEFSADSKPSTNKIDELQPSPRKRKGSLTTTDDKQPTLLSYFGKR